MKNKKLSAYLQYTWVSYAAVLLAAIVLWSIVFQSLAKPKADEKVVIAFFTDNWNSDPFVAYLDRNRESITAQELKTITSKNHEIDDFMLTTYIEMRLSDSDILIMPESLFSAGENQLSVAEVFRPIDKGLLQDLLGEDVSLFEANGSVYGVYLNGEGSENLFVQYFDGEGRYIACFSHHSVNLHGLYGQGDAQNGAAVDTLAYILQEYTKNIKIGLPLISYDSPVLYLFYIRNG